MIMQTYVVHNQRELEKAWSKVKGGDFIILVISEEIAKLRFQADESLLPDTEPTIDCCYLD